jgi:hypothetical protein
MAISKISSDALGNDSGNVGIGTNSPSTKARLTVDGVTGANTGGGILITGSGYQTNPAGLLLGQYTSTIGYIQAPAGGQIDIWDDASNSIAQFKDNGDFRFNSGYGTAGVAYGCRAWVNFNGQGTVAIRASGNVSSITDLGTGNYRVNFTTAMPNTNYACVVSTKQTDDASYNYVGVAFTQDFVTTYAEILCRPVSTSDSKVDLQTISVSIFR